jgi:protein-tyrosine-phosphatase
MNLVRSPMAAALLKAQFPNRIFVESCGVFPADGMDPFVVAVMAERAIDLSNERPKTFEAVGAGAFDAIICLTEDAHGRALDLARLHAVDVEFWPIEDPTLETGARSHRLEAYRRVRDDLDLKIAARFTALKS